MKSSTALRGLSTISFYADNLEEAQKWYSNFLGMEPYYTVPGYIEFRLGDYHHELGIIDSRYAPQSTATPAGAIAFWHVDDLQATLDTLLALGATLHQPVTDHSQGAGNFVTASVVDPFGNILGIMINQHYLEILQQSQNN